MSTAPAGARRARGHTALLAACVLVLVLAGCGGADGDANRGGPPQRGGTLHVVASGDFQTLDPGLAYYSLDYALVYATQRPLYSFEPDATETATPDLAAAPPVVTDDGRTVTVRLKPGLRFGPPVNRVITSADVKYAIERAFSAAVPNLYVGTHFSVIEGAPEPGRATVPDIPGIETPTPTTIVFRLSRPSGTFVRALTLPATAPVPREYAAPHDAKTPSDYGLYAVGSGPYRMAAATDGRATYRRGRSLVIVRNPNWVARSDYRPAYVDRTEFSLGNEDTAVATRRILGGRGMVSGEFIPDLPQLRNAVRRRRDQVVSVSIGSQYAALNTQLAPLDDLDVRRAIVAASDRRALLLAAGGPLVGQLATHFLPPGVPGFEQAGGVRGPDLDFLANPSGDLALARRYMRRAGYESGSYTGDKPLLMVSDDSASGKRVAEVLQAAIEKLGFDVELREIARDVMYARCGTPKEQVAVCPSVGWGPDFPDGQAMLALTFGGDAIVPEGNTNWPQLADPAIDDAMAGARSITDPDERARRWGAIDRLITAQAPAIPYLWNRVPGIQSEDVNGVMDRFSGAFDLSFTGLR
jgi:peptide/nickel transport system substrate-binding protein